MTAEEDTPIFERGDVVYGDDPFTDEEQSRPWVILTNHEGRPFHGEQYIALTLTSNRGWTASSTSQNRAGFAAGRRTRAESSRGESNPIDRADIDFWQGRLESTPIDRAVAALVEELQ